LTYRDAVRILGARNSPLVTALDKVFGGLLLGATAGVPELLSIFDAKSELSRLANELVAGGIDKRLKLTQFDRIQRLHAARGVLMVTAYFEAVERVELPFQFSDTGIERKHQIGLVTGTFTAESLFAVANTILKTDLPLLGVQAGGDSSRQELERFYTTLNKNVRVFIQGLDIWDQLDTTQQGQAEVALGRVTGIAMRLFDASMQRLATECPEFAIWLNLSGHKATLDQLAILRGAVQALLDRAEPVDQVPPALQGVVRFNRSVLARKLVSAEELPDGLDAPTVDRAYLDPYFRMVEVNAQTPVNDEDYWSRIPARKDFNQFLLGYLSTPWAWANPLVILGHPGAGKSLLTEVQAARLPSPGFVSVRVPLRDVPADGEIHEQIEYAIRLSTHETVSWPDLARGAGESLLVVFLDGFDELIQATGVSKSDYLMRVKKFQEIEETQGRHVAVIVTSRVTVADRMRIPAGTVAVRLEPFEIHQVEEWVEVWNSVNHDYLVRHDREFLNLDFIDRYLSLASQPLLLLMLAIYHAEGGALLAENAKLSQTELYERLLVRFARREVSKKDSQDGDPAVERELMVLSVVAFGMFNRGAQWITDAQLADDLIALRITTDSLQTITAKHQHLAGPAKDALGRFFFIHRARTTLTGADLSSYEFLHATFGEYLVVRLIWRCLTDMVERAHAERTRMFPGAQRVDDAELRAFLSYSVLSVRATTVQFLSELIGKTTSEQRTGMRRVLLEAFKALHVPADNSAFSAYQPVEMTQTAQLTTYSANLIVLIVTLDEHVSSEELFPDNEDHLWEWTRLVKLWQSQLKPGEWISMTGKYTVTLFPEQDEEGSAQVTVRDPGSLGPLFRVVSRHIPPNLTDGAFYEFPLNFFQSADLACDPDMDMIATAFGGENSLLAALIPYHVAEGGELHSIAANVVAATLFHVNGTDPRTRMDVYDRITDFANSAATVGDYPRAPLGSFILQLLVNDDRIPPEYVLEKIDFLPRAKTARNIPLFLRLLAKSPMDDYFFEVIDEILTEDESTLEEVAEIWCALAGKGVPSSAFPAVLRDRAHDLHWPEREDLLAHRPDLLKRLSALEDAELL
jgi:hypothetical protein